MKHISKYPSPLETEGQIFPGVILSYTGAVLVGRMACTKPQFWQLSAQVSQSAFPGQAPAPGAGSMSRTQKA